MWESHKVLSVTKKEEGIGGLSALVVTCCDVWTSKSMRNSQRIEVR
jgi:hypothetical protein